MLVRHVIHLVVLYIQLTAIFGGIITINKAFMSLYHLLAIKQHNTACYTGITLN